MQRKIQILVSSDISCFIFFQEGLCLCNICIAERALSILTNHMREKCRKSTISLYQLLLHSYTKMKTDFTKTLKKKKKKGFLFTPTFPSCESKRWNLTELFNTIQISITPWQFTVECLVDPLVKYLSPAFGIYGRVPLYRFWI